MMKRWIRGLFVIAMMQTAFISAMAEGGEPDRSGSAIEYAEGQIVLTLEEYLSMGNAEWFLTGKKQYPVQAMMVSKETGFHNPLEVTDYLVTDDGETVILKGPSDEMWASRLSNVRKTYTRPDGSPVTEADFAPKDEFIDLISIPAPDSNFAMHVPLGFSVTVETSWGDVLHTNLPNAPHGDGDFLVCRAGEDGKPDLSDVWVLNGALFPDRYDPANYTETAAE